VVAETQAQARDAAELVGSTTSRLPAVALLEDAAKDTAPKVWDDNPNGNVAFQLMFGNKDATDAAFAGAKHVVKLRMENNRLTPVSMEPRTAIGDYNAAEDAYTLYTSSQNRTAPAPRSRISSMSAKIRCAWCRRMSAAASA
jgi:carbon-monoxide dehydrogenase large subunit